MGAGPEILRDPDRDPHRILKIGTDQPDKGKHKITLDVNQLGPGGGSSSTVVVGRFIEWFEIAP